MNPKVLDPVPGGANPSRGSPLFGSITGIMYPAPAGFEDFLCNYNVKLFLEVSWIDSDALADHVLFAQYATDGWLIWYISVCCVISRGWLDELCTAKGNLLLSGSCTTSGVRRDFVKAV